MCGRGSPTLHSRHFRNLALRSTEPFQAPRTEQISLIVPMLDSAHSPTLITQHTFSNSKARGRLERPERVFRPLALVPAPVHSRALRTCRRVWWAKRDLNPRMPGCKPGALAGLGDSP